MSRIATVLLVAALAMGFSTPSAKASLAEQARADLNLTYGVGDVVEIQFTGLDLTYDGTDIVDATDPVGGSGDPAEADPLTTMVFLVNGSLVGTLTDDIFADVLVQDVLNIPDTGGVVTSGGNGGAFGFDLLTSLAGWGISLDIDKVKVYYTGDEVAIAAAGVATQIGYQDLPFDIVLDGAKTVSIVASSTNLSNLTASGGYLTGFDASGTGSVKGVFIPEPATLGLVALGGLGAFLRRKRQ
jgi:hypothetical protein